MGERQEVRGREGRRTKYGRWEEGGEKRVFTDNKALNPHSEKNTISRHFWAVASSLLVIPFWDDAFHLKHLQTK